MTDPGAARWPAGARGTPSGFDLRPARPVLVTLLLFCGVVTGAAVFAHVFRATTLAALDWLTDARSPITAATSLHPVALCLLVASAVVVAATVGNVVDARWRRYVGVEAVAASARGEQRSISMRASTVRAGATWLMSVCAVSVGRESAIIETGGAVGAHGARRLGGRGDAMAVAGIAAAFAAAYHAPIAALLYLDEHLSVGRSNRALLFALAGASGGYFATVWLFSAEPLFPPVQGSMWPMIGWSLVAVVPALLAARVFLHLRVRMNGRATADRLGLHRWIVVALLSIVAGLAIAVFPYAAGNGMEALGAVADAPTVTLALGLSVGKLVGTTAALASGAPGGVLTPSMSIAGGVGLLVLLGVGELGVGIDHRWDVVVACMAVGVAVGLRSPLVAIVLVPEMMGDYWLIPPIAVVVAVAVVLDRVIDRLVRRVGVVVPVGIYDEDA